jgi:ABC-type amino acid transport substrate-binding protein
MKRIRHFFFLILLIGTAFAADNTNPDSISTDNSNTNTNNSVTVGFLKFAPPLSSLGANNTFFGFYIDLMNEICKRINETCKYKAVSLDKQMDDLDKGIIDITFPTSAIPQNPLPSYVYSIPVLTSNGQFLALNPNIKSIIDLKDKKIGVLQESHLEQILLLYTSLGNIKEYSKPQDLFLALENNDVDAILLNVNIVKYIINNQMIKSQLVGKPISLGNGYGIMVIEPNASLINRINKALLEIENDGTYEIIYNKYFAK